MRPLPLLLAAAAALAACQSTPDGPVNETGTLENGDATLTSGEYADRFTVRLKQDQWLRVTLDSDAFDPYLVVRFPNQQQSDRDDSTPGDTTTVSMAIRAQEAGTYEILATTYRVGASGEYRLTYEVSDTELTVPTGTADAPADAPAGGAAGETAVEEAEPGTGGSREIRSREGDAPTGPGEGAPGADEATLDA